MEGVKPLHEISWYGGGTKPIHVIPRNLKVVPPLDFSLLHNAQYWALHRHLNYQHMHCKFHIEDSKREFDLMIPP